MADTTSSVDASLWWESFSLLLTELENSSLSSEIPPNLVLTISTISLYLSTRACEFLNFRESFYCLFRRRSWRTTIPGSLIHFRSSSLRIRNPRMLWIRSSWKLDLTSWISNSSWKIKRCRLVPAWSVSSSFVLALNDHYYIIIIIVVVIYLFGLLWSEIMSLLYDWKWCRPRFVVLLNWDCLDFHPLYYGELTY